MEKSKKRKDNISDNNEVLIIPIMNGPIFPGMIAPVILNEGHFLESVESYLKGSKYLGLNLIKEKKEKDANEAVVAVKSKKRSSEKKSKSAENVVKVGDIYKLGVICKVVKRLNLPDGSVNLLVHGIKRYKAENIQEVDDTFMTQVKIYEDVLDKDAEMDAYTRSIINQVKKLSETNPYFNEEMRLAMLNASSSGALADLVAFSLSLSVSEAQDFLETLVVKKRFGKLLVYLEREKNVADIQKKISDEVNDKVTKYQREYFLKEQLKVIKTELGHDEDDKARDIKKFRQEMDEKNVPKEVRKIVEEELEKLETTPDTSPEYSVIRNYLNWMTQLPWNISDEESVDIKMARGILDKDHYGLEKPKERILEYLAVRKLKPEYDGTILCFAGPPGVGKTSLGKSIAKALGRKFYRFSLGGSRDESEIKGHRRTYVGAMPGKLIQALKRVEVNNPVIMLDEIDKMTRSYQGDPASALLEVLDPEQNSQFIDNYLDVPFDLSKVLFIATANYLGEIPDALLDRLEVIELSGYTIEEKVSIANKWVIPKLLKKHGLKRKDFQVSPKTLKRLIADYAREPGVRMMEQYLAKLCRKAVLLKVEKNLKDGKVFGPSAQDLEKLLGSIRFKSDLAEKKLIPGVVTGLAWTMYGGEILFIESIPLHGKGGLKVTGQLGDVMNESANLAYSYVKKILQDEIDEEHKTVKVNKGRVVNKVEKVSSKKEEVEETDEDGTPLDYLSNHEIHLHIPAGATPKDGPSAGISMALALYSLAHNRRVRPSMAMTGELSLTGKVLPIGGLKEKILAAKRAGIKRVIFPKQNEKDLKEVPESHLKGLQFFPVNHFDDVLKVAFNKK